MEYSQPNDKQIEVACSNSIAENHFLRAAGTARAAHERRTLEALTDGLVNLDLATGTSPRAFKPNQQAQSVFSDAVRLARTGCVPF